MFYSFAAERKIAFTVMANGVRWLVEFGDRNINGASSFTTKNAKVAQAIRKHSLSRRGVIIETTPHQIEEAIIEEPKPQPRTLAVVKGIVKPGNTKKPVTKTNKTTEPKDPDKPTGEVREYANFSVAKNAICKEFNIPKTKVKNPGALAKIAAEKGFTIKYTSAEK